MSGKIAHRCVDATAEVQRAVRQRMPEKFAEILVFDYQQLPERIFCVKSFPCGRTLTLINVVYA